MTVYLLGTVPYDALAQLQRRLVEDALSRSAQGRDEQRIVTLFCEHPATITIGRGGSRRHVRFSSDELSQKQLAVRWVNRSGGAMLHGPGQLAMYVIAPLAELGWTTTEFKRRLRTAIAKTLTALNFSLTTHSDATSGQPLPPTLIVGRTGILATVGVGVRQGISHHGAYINVAPAMSDFEFVDVISPDRLPAGIKTTLSCLLAEHRQPIKMPSLRAELMNQLADAFGQDRFHIATGHPWLPKSANATRQLLD